MGGRLFFVPTLFFFGKELVNIQNTILPKRAENKALMFSALIKPLTL